MESLIKFTAPIFILLNLCACNNDVFIDDFRPPVSELALNGNGDSAIIHFKASNWDILSIPSYLSFKVYDENGNLSDQQSYLEGLGQIVYDKEMVSFAIERSNPQEVAITVKENAGLAPFQFTLIASSKYESKEINIAISPCDRYEAGHITYSLDSYYYDLEQIEEKKRFTVENHTDAPLKIPLFPYENEYRTVLFIADNPSLSSLLADDKEAVDIPNMFGRNLVMDGKQAQYALNTQKLPLPFSDTGKTEMAVPPHASWRVTLLLGYEWFATKYRLYAVNPKSGKQRTITGIFYSKTPNGKYDVAHEDIDN